MNIHERMMGHIYVADTPHFERAGTDGIASFEGPLGRSRVRVWHPRLNGGREEGSRHISLSGGAAQIRFELELAEPAASQQSPTLLAGKNSGVSGEDP